MAVKEKSAVRVRMGRGGRLVIPSRMRQELDLKPGTELFLSKVEGHLELSTPQARFLEIQEWLRSYIKPGVSLVDELIAERREAAVRGE
ncbi:MAG: AbrB/MazE/SpoVT family DNA-binding domain-containing protein [Candidatus Dormibacteraceae bacterium]